MIEQGEQKREVIPNERQQLAPAVPPEYVGGGQDTMGAEGYLPLATYWRVLRNRWWLVATVALVITTAVAIASFRMTPIYSATARVEIDGETPTIGSVSDASRPLTNYVDDGYLLTQIQVLKNDVLAWKTIQQLGLQSNPAFAGPGGDGQDPEQRKVDLIGMFLGQLSISLVPNTRVVSISFQSSDPRVASQVATALATNYIDWNFQVKYDATRQASAWMEQQLDELKANVEKSQHALVDYERQYAIAHINEKQNIQEQILSDLSKDLTTAQSERIQREALYQQSLSDPSKVAGLAQDALLQKLQATAADLNGQRSEIVAQYGPNFPRAVRVDKQIADNRAQIDREQSRVIEQIHTTYLAASTRERLAQAAVERQKQVLSELNQQLYQNLLERLKDATVSAGLRSTNIHLIDAARIPRSPIRPRRGMNIAMGLCTGLVLGIMAAFAVEALDRSIRSAEDVEKLMLAPMLAVVPLDRPRRTLMSAKDSERLVEPSSREAIDLAVLQRPTSQIAEAYRALRTAVLLSVSPNPPRTLLVTSTGPEEGKTTTVLNLAQAMAQTKGRVLVMDCDLRKRAVGFRLGIGNKRGLSTVLTGNDKLDDVLQQYGGLPSLWVLPAGPVPPNPSELLSSEMMPTILDQLRERFDYVIIDSPPVLAVTDATILSVLAEGVVLLAASGSTHRVALLRAYKVLESASARVVGLVLNNLDLEQSEYGSYAYYHYRGYQSYHPEITDES